MGIRESVEDGIRVQRQEEATRECPSCGEQAQQTDPAGEWRCDCGHTFHEPEEDDKDEMTGISGVGYGPTPALGQPIRPRKQTRKKRRDDT